ncbi:hypothetical protein [Dishui Lake large algae virus 1]|nr:hypothetical protein [Dishui Lake large algae virus 1]
MYPIEDTPIELRLHPFEGSFPSAIPGTRSFTEAPCYVVRGIFSYKNTRYIAHSYKFYFADNLAIGFGWCCFPKADCLGYHANDVEGIVVLYDYDNKKPRWVYYDAHSRGQGEWVAWDKCEKTRDGALVVYSARGSHGMYAKGKTYLRGFGFANDLCSKNGKHIRITEYLNAFNWKSPNGIKLTDTIQNLAQKSVTPWQRFVICYYVDKLRNGM